MGRVSEVEARQIIRGMCSQYIEDEPARSESVMAELDRLEQLEDDITDAIGADIRHGSLADTLTTLDGIQSVECGTHPELIRNQALTINTAPDILDRLESQLREDLWFVLQAAGFTPARRLAA